MPKDTCVVKVSVLDVPTVVKALDHLRLATVLLGDIEHDGSVPPHRRQQAREWRETISQSFSSGLQPVEPSRL